MNTMGRNTAPGVHSPYHLGLCPYITHPILVQTGPGCRDMDLKWSLLNGFPQKNMGPGEDV
jgi:hypothetical protein